MVRDIWSADTLKLNFSLYTGLRLRRLTRVFALDKRAPSQYSASFTYGSAEKGMRKLRWLSPPIEIATPHAHLLVSPLCLSCLT